VTRIKHRNFPEPAADLKNREVETTVGAARPFTYNQIGNTSARYVFSHGYRDITNVVPQILQFPKSVIVIYETYSELKPLSFVDPFPILQYFEIALALF
jgi:hypothetical protein